MQAQRSCGLSWVRILIITFEFFYGNMKSRTVPVAINWRLAAPEIAFILNDSESEILFVDGEFDELIKQIENEIPKVRKIITIGKFQR